MKKYILSISLIFIFTLNINAHVDHYSKYNYLEYELFRNNKLIGNHIFYFNSKGSSITVKSEGNFKVNKMGVKLMDYHTKSTANYINGKLNSFKSETFQNDKNKHVKLALDNNNFYKIDGSSFKGKTDSKSSIIGSWWNHDIINKKKQISIVSGRIIDQKVKFLGKENIFLGNKSYNALHFHFLSNDNVPLNKKKINIHVWYDSETLLWLKSSYKKFGAWEYRLKKAEF